MRTRRPDLWFLGIALLVVTLLAGFGWLSLNYLQFETGEDAFAPIWSAVRYVIVERGNPYSDQAVVGVVGSSNFVYPYYSIPYFAPYAMISSYPVARAVWMTVSAAGLVGLAFMGLMLADWRPPIGALVVYLLFSIGNYHAVRAVLVGNPAVLTALLVGLGLLMVTQERDGLAGVFLGLTIIKPQMVILLLPFVVLWAVSVRRIRIAVNLLVAALIFILASFIFMPTWIVGNYHQALAFFQKGPPSSPPTFLWFWWQGIGTGLLTGIAIAFGVWLVVEWWRALGKPVDWFLWASALTLTITNLIGIPTSLSNLVVLVLALALPLSIWSRRWEKMGVRWSVIIMLILGAVTWVLPLSSGAPIFSAEVHPALFFVTPLVTLVSLYWVRYWALRSVRLKVSHLEALKRL